MPSASNLTLLVVAVVAVAALLVLLSMINYQPRWPRSRPGEPAISRPATNRVAAVAVWVLGAWLSLIVMPIAQGGDVPVISAQFTRDRSVVRVTVPFAGGCAGSSLQAQRHWDGDTLVVWVESDETGFNCLAACLEERCTESVRLELDRPAAPGTEIVMAQGVGLNLPTAAGFGVALGALALGYWLWSRDAAAPEKPAEPVVAVSARR